MIKQLKPNNMEKQTTGIQQLLEFIEYRKSKCIPQQLSAYNIISAEIKEKYLPLERQQIEDAFKSAISIHGSEEWKQDEAEQYFNQTFK